MEGGLSPPQLYTDMENTGLYQQCCDLYHAEGYSAVMDFILKEHPEVPWDKCEPCEMVVPFEEGTCLVCGTFDEAVR